MATDTPSTPDIPHPPEVMHHYVEKDGNKVEVGTSVVTLGEIHHFRKDNGNNVEIGMTKRGENHAVTHSVLVGDGYKEIETEPFKERFQNKKLVQVWSEINSNFRSANPEHPSNNSVAGNLPANDNLISQVEYPNPGSDTIAYPSQDTSISALDRFKIAATSTTRFTNIVPRQPYKIKKRPQTAVVTATHYLLSADETTRTPIGSTTVGKNGEIHHYGIEGGDEFKLGTSELESDGKISHQRWNTNGDHLGFGKLSEYDPEMTIADCWRIANDPHKNSTTADKAPKFFDIISDPRINIPPGQRIESEGDMTVNDAIKLALTTPPDKGGGRKK